MLEKQMKNIIKQLATKSGWFIRKTCGLPYGVSFERDWVKIFKQYPKIIFDIGGHHGESIDRFKNSFPNAKIYSFEPIKKNFEKLIQKASQKNIYCFNFAFGPKPEIKRIKLVKNSQTFSLRKPTRKEIKNNKWEKIKVQTIDKFVEESKINQNIDLLKIDTEGFEIAVLKGAEKVLARGLIKSIFAEVSLEKKNNYHTSFSALEKKLDSEGFRFVGVYDQEWISSCSYLNALFVKKTFLTKNNERY